jgi:hypothetical protein
MERKPGTIQVDLDGYWAYQSFLGRPYQIEEDRLFERAVGKFLDLFDRWDIKATFFVNSLDLEVDWKRDLIMCIASQGHEIGNHGFSHKYLKTLELEEKKGEIIKSTERLSSFLGNKIYGFRAPGYSIDLESIKILKENGYRYDSSVFPTIFAPLFRIYQKFISGSKNTGYSNSMFVLLNPYRLSKENIFKKGNTNMIEIPVTVCPILRTPLHFSYLTSTGKSYFNLGFELINLLKITPNFVFHSIDLVDFCSKFDDLKKIPVFTKPLRFRLDLAEYILEKLKKRYDLVTTIKLCSRFFGEIN